MQIVVRVLVALLALAGAGGAIFTAMLLQAILIVTATEVREEYGIDSIEEYSQLPSRAVGQFRSQQDADLANLKLDLYLRTSKGLWFLYTTGGFALFGLFLAVFGQGKSAAAILLVAPLGPVVILPFLSLLLAAPFISPLPLAGLLAFLIHLPSPFEPTPVEE